MTVNKHMLHLEELVLQGAAKEAINYLRNMGAKLTGQSAAVDVTVKWDGAPAIFAGVDPSDGRFFVAKKGILNKNPKVYKTPNEVDADTQGDLAMKLQVALEELPKLGIKGVVQGDFLYTKNDLKTVDIDGNPHLTFHPNTIVYAVPRDSEAGAAILASELGVVWHTTYRGQSFERMQASFGEAIADHLEAVKSVWSVDAAYNGTTRFTAAEAAQFGSLLTKAERFNLPEAVTADFPLERSAVFINTKVRAGEAVDDPAKFVSELKSYLAAYYDKEIDSKKSEAGKATWSAKKASVAAYFDTHGSHVVKLFSLYNTIVEAKLVIIRKLDEAKAMGTFLLTQHGLKTTEQEGFVAIDKSSGAAVKFVDRLQFSHANFGGSIKGWQNV